MRARAVGLVMVIATLVLVTAWMPSNQLLLVREHARGVVTLRSGGSFSFSFDVFPVGSDVQYSFVVLTGPQGAVEVRSTNPSGDYEFSMTPVNRTNNLNPGTYQVTLYPGSVWYPGTEANSTIGYDLTSVGYPGGSFGAAVYTAFPFVLILSPVPLIVGVFLILDGPLARPPAYCPYCGQHSGKLQCPHCGLPRSIACGRKD